MILDQKWNIFSLENHREKQNYIFGELMNQTLIAKQKVEV